MNTPYKRTSVKQIADECHKQGIKLFLYYSLLDWRRDDYSWTTGRTGQGTGRTVQGKWDDYIQFMKNQLTELLSNYGEIAGIWFDGHWDQTAPEGAADRSARIDWHYSEIYGLIHKLQPQCLIGNNHHLSPFQAKTFKCLKKIFREKINQASAISRHPTNYRSKHVKLLIIPGALILQILLIKHMNSCCNTL